MIARQLLSAALLALLPFSLPTTARAQDPTPPPGGFPVVKIADRPVVWSDGFRTKMDIYLPNVPPPATGWPGVLTVHGGGGDRNLPEMVRTGNYLAAFGYVVYAYDVRGNGGTPAWNPGWTGLMNPERALCDSAESHGAAQALVPGSIDPTRLAVTGTSMGGSHSIEAAAWSGKLLPAAGAPGLVTHYPTILAAAPKITPLDRSAANLPGGVLANDEMIDDLDPLSPLLLMLNAGDYLGAQTYVSGQFSAGVLPLLRQSDVPLLVMNAWQDFKHQLNTSADALQTLKPGVPRRLFLSTTGHSTPQNDHEILVHLDLKRRWFDRFLKGIQNHVTDEAFAELAVQPDEPAQTRAASIWEHRQNDVWPPVRAKTALYLRGNGALDRTAPPAAEPGALFAHRVAPGYDLSTHVQTHASKDPAARLFPFIPKLERQFETAPLPEAAEVFGRTHVEFQVDDTTGTCQLSVELSHVAPDGTESFITFGTGGMRGAGAGRHVLAFDLCDIAHVVPAGHRLRATVMNLAHHEPPGFERIRFAPYFTDTDTTLLFEPAAASRIDVPLRPYVPNLRPRLGEQSAAAGVDHRLLLDAGAPNAGRGYVVFLGASGEAPGVALPGLPRIPLNPDAWTELGVLVQNTPAFPAFLGFLDGQGRAAPRVVLPAGPLANAVVGARFTFAAVVIGPGPVIEAVSGPTTLCVVP